MERAFADVAQLVEQSIRNRQVTGSIPVVGSIIIYYLTPLPSGVSFYCCTFGAYIFAETVGLDGRPYDNSGGTSDTYTPPY